jgi:hypothetical protein
MNPDIQRIAQALVVFGSFATFVVALTIITRFAFRKSGPVALGSRDDEPRIDDSRFSRLEEAVDSIAIEVERIAEAQRFTAKLMSERLPDRLSDATPDRMKQR